MKTLFEKWLFSYIFKIVSHILNVLGDGIIREINWFFCPLSLLSILLGAMRAHISLLWKMKIKCSRFQTLLLVAWVYMKSLDCQTDVFWQKYKILSKDVVRQILADNIFQIQSSNTIEIVEKIHFLFIIHLVSFIILKKFRDEGEHFCLRVCPKKRVMKY